MNQKQKDGIATLLDNLNCLCIVAICSNIFDRLTLSPSVLLTLYWLSLIMFFAAILLRKD